MKRASAWQVAAAMGAVLVLLVVAVAVLRPKAPPTSAPNATPTPLAAMPRGQQVYEKWCAPCHARGPGHPGTQSLEVKYGGKLPPALEDRTDLTPEVTAQFVRHGIALMPPFRKTEISDDDLKALGAYLAHRDGQAK